MGKSNISVFWVNRLSVSTLWKVFRVDILRQGIDIRFINNTYFGWTIFQCLIFFNIIKGLASKIEYSMGDMRSITGESLQYESYRVSSETTIAVVDRLKELPVYHGLTSLLPQNKVDLYLEKRIYDEIFPLIRLLCIIRWQIRNEEGQYHHIIIWPENGFFSELQHVWPDKTISLVANKLLLKFSWVRPFIKKLYHLSQDIFASILPESLRPCSGENSCIAVHYVEGIDLKRRSDIFWHPDSRIDPERVIVYFDRSYNHPITREHIRQIESMGMRWINLSWRRDLPLSLKSVWRVPLGTDSLLKAFKRVVIHNDRNIDRIEKWLSKIGAQMLKEVEYWQAFYRMFNVKVHHDALEAGLQNIAQHIALDLVGGIRVGKQRSELFIPVSDMIGYYPDHIYFSWNCRAPEHLQADRNRNDYCIVSGFPYDVVFSKLRNEDYYLREHLDNEENRFLITLYDNVFGADMYYSKAMMLSFYRNFLEWSLEDQEVGLIIKSKKPHILNTLPEIRDLLASAETSGRCIQLGNVYGRLPSDAAHGVNIVVGVGISSAVTEAIISAGCRGVHCDLTGLHSHLFYQWGYGKVVFDDIDKLIAALKRFKKKPENEPELGDWSSHIDKLDPLRDGRGGERIGTYMRWLLESFDKGKNRDKAIQYANVLYANQWGEDKVIDMIKHGPDFSVNNRVVCH